MHYIAEGEHRTASYSYIIWCDIHAAAGDMMSTTIDNQEEPTDTEAGATLCCVMGMYILSLIHI